jgi:hypothetical protein
MNTRTRWISVSVVIYALIVSGHVAALRFLDGRAEALPLFQISYGAMYFALGIALLGAVARAWPQVGAPLWRPLMLASAMVLGLLEFWLVTTIYRHPVLPDDWAVALLGVAFAAISPRLIPELWLRRWLAQDRRGVAR